MPGFSKWGLAHVSQLQDTGRSGECTTKVAHTCQANSAIPSFSFTKSSA
jgi:hypothetical protein